MSTIKEVFTENVNRLNSLLQHSIEDFAREMLENGLIPNAVSRDPKYTIVIDSFLASFCFITEKKEIERQCLNFLKVLDNIGVKKPSEYMKKQLVDKVKQKLNIDLHLDE